MAIEACTRALPPVEVFGDVKVRCIRAGEM
jgi:hypothetical protein